MADAIRIKLDTNKYATPTEEDIRAAKQYILQREENARLLEDVIDQALEIAAANIVYICYRHGVNPKTFTISSSYNEGMMTEISSVMDELEEEILSLIERYALVPTQDEDKRQLLILWLMSLGRGNRNLRDTLNTYLLRFLGDIEAAIAALVSKGRSVEEAESQIIKYLHDIYNMPEVVDAIRHKDDYAAGYILSEGIQKGAVGISNNGATNVVNMGVITLQIAWMREQGEDFIEKGAIGYYQLRGSLFDCPSCDEEVGFHDDLRGLFEHPYIHPHCKCYRIPIFTKEQKEQIDGVVNK